MFPTKLSKYRISTIGGFLVFFMKFFSILKKRITYKSTPNGLCISQSRITNQNPLYLV
jgi:hypothetical protein